MGGSGHRDVAVDRALGAGAEGLRVDEDDEVELEALRVFGGQRPDAGRRPERAAFDLTGADDAGDPVCSARSVVVAVDRNACFVE